MRRGSSCVAFDNCNCWTAAHPCRRYRRAWRRAACRGCECWVKNTSTTSPSPAAAASPTSTWTAYYGGSTSPSPVPSLAPTTINYRLADFSAAPPLNWRAAFTGTGLKVEHLVVNLTVPATEPVHVSLSAWEQGGGGFRGRRRKGGGALRFYDEDPDNPGYALVSDRGRAFVTKIIPAGDTILTLAAGALRDRVNNGQSVVQTITVSLDSDDPIYGRERTLSGRSP